MEKNRSTIRHWAQKHDEQHQTIKKRVLSSTATSEKLLKLFLITFLLVFATVAGIKHGKGIWEQWQSTADKPSEVKQEEEIPPPLPSEFVSSNGFKTGVLSFYKINHQIQVLRQQVIDQISTKGSVLGIKTAQILSEPAPEAPPSEPGEFKNGLWITNYLGTGQSLTRLKQGNAGLILKSMVTNYYLGERTQVIDSTLEKDTRLLSQINNAVSVDLFQYLNRAVSRADALDEYISLLNQLKKRSEARINDLTSKINFLSQNVIGTEQRATQFEDQFFQKLEQFNGKDAWQDYNQFVSLSEGQVETRAKMGTYRTLKEYYEYFQPTLNNLILSVEVNRDALIAGVRVVEIENMQLPLIIRE
ncbi:hypothetical protein IPJ72_02585 [Candidatus Peregrinibacteria bacterium]|nr:MAG: hypothetical protein IPJ72_02585 [Candidatus Peregrinibacteria bacterium]